MSSKNPGAGKGQAVLLSLILCGAAQAAAPPAGAELLKPFKQQLMGALKAGLEQGPAEAIAACSVKAPEIAAGLSVEGVSMGRASHQLRNPANAAPDWVAPVIQDYLAEDAAVQPRVVTIADGLQGYVEPIRVKSMCLMCHGASLAPEVSARIAELYPEDQATGFEVGDLRGVFWVSWPEG
jgi:hypothetical protein